MKLKDKCGSYSTDKEFKRLISKIAAEDIAHAHIPDYNLRIEGSQAVFYSKGSIPAPLVEVFEGLLELDAYDAAREAAPGWDVRHLEHEWRRWCGKEEIDPKHPTKHYLKFCHSWFEKRGKP